MRRWLVVCLIRTPASLEMPMWEGHHPWSPIIHLTWATRCSSLLDFLSSMFCTYTPSSRRRRAAASTLYDTRSAGSDRRCLECQSIVEVIVSLPLVQMFMCPVVLAVVGRGQARVASGLSPLHTYVAFESPPVAGIEPEGAARAPVSRALPWVEMLIEPLYTTV